MAVKKTDHFREDTAWMADVAKALSHPARVKILQILAEKNTCVCGELVDMLPLSQSTVSQHLKELKRVGLIKGDIEGPRTCYCLDIQVARKAQNAITKLFAAICGRQ
jgi:DNA-binding transcriptional ArsR family regulator